LYLIINFVARLCPADPPSPWLGIDMDWPLKKKTLGTTVSYTCPFMTKTNDEELLGNTIQPFSLTQSVSRIHINKARLLFFESILTNFELSSWCISEIGSELKIKILWANEACPNLWNIQYLIRELRHVVSTFLYSLYSKFVQMLHVC